MPDRPSTKDARREAAREKSRQMRELEARKKRRNRVLAISAGVVAVVLVIGFVALAITRSGGSSAEASATPPGVTAEGGILTGSADAPHQVVIYQDYQCPACKAWEESVGPWLLEQRDAGVTSVEYRPIAILNRASGGTEYSTRSASAAFCLAGQQGVDFDAFNKAMYLEQPAEGGTGLTDNKLVSIAEAAGATNVGSCIASRTYGAYADAMTQKATAGDVASTPTILVDGQKAQSDGGYPPSQQELATALGVSA